MFCLGFAIYLPTVSDMIRYITNIRICSGSSGCPSVSPVSPSVSHSPDAIPEANAFTIYNINVLSSRYLCVTFLPFAWSFSIILSTSFLLISRT